MMLGGRETSNVALQTRHMRSVIDLNFPKGCIRKSRDGAHVMHTKRIPVIMLLRNSPIVALES